MGDIKIILRLGQPDLPLLTPQLQPLDCLNICYVPSLWKLLQPKHQKFRQNWPAHWNVFKQIANMSPRHIDAQLQSTCTDTAQNSLVNTVTNFFDLNKIQLLETLERIFTKISNPTVHPLQFSSPIWNEIYAGICCLLTINFPRLWIHLPKLLHGIQEYHIKYQLIRELHILIF